MFSTSPRRRAPILRVASLALLASLLLAAVAVAKPSTGRFKVTSGSKFAFTIEKGVCYGAPKNLSNDQARAGKKKAGYCFSAGDGPKIDPKCPAGYGPITGAQAAIAPMTGLRLSPSGALHVKSYESSGSNSKPTGFTELSVTVKGKRATGFYRTTTQLSVADDGTPIVCDTGKVPFTASAR